MYHVLLYLWLIGSLLRHCKVPKYYVQDYRFNGVLLRDNLRTIKVGAFDIWLSTLIPLEKNIFCNNIFFDKSITRNIFRIHDDDSIMCGFYCIVCREYMIAGKTLLDYTNLFGKP